MRNPVGLFYGWYMVGAGLVIQLMIGAFMFQAYGAYVEALREQYGWSRTLFSAGFSMSRVESGLLGPVQGWAVDRFGPRILAHIGLGMMGLGFLAFSQINSPLTFLLAFFVIAVRVRASAGSPR
ncbi:MAG: hypothetical protein U5Q44_01280 [Dehalococcoidia bacterium]|nr:hypothetical protein [Dehalococcoidia bacterium]